MAMGPRLTPFPWETYFFDKRVMTELQILDALNTSQNDGVQFNVNLSGYAGSWTNPHTCYAPGLLFPPENDTFYATRVPYIPLAVLVAGTPPYVPSGVELDPWTHTINYLGGSSNNLLNHPENLDPIIKQRYTSTDVRYGASDGNKGPIPTIGLHEYPGVWGLVGRDYMAPIWCNAPIGYECWFSENPNRSNSSIGYSGYTMFGDQGNPEFNTWGIFTDVPDAYTKKYVVGMMRTSATLNNPSTTDMMMGVIVTYDNTNTIVQACANGTVVWSKSYNRAFHPYDFNFWFETAWGGDANPVIPFEHWTGWMDEFDISIMLDHNTYTHDFKYMSSYDGTNLDPDGIYIPSYDTYDIKFGMWLDAYSPSYPINQPVPSISVPGEPIKVNFDSINIYTHRYWTVPLLYTNSESTIQTNLGYISTKQVSTNNYIVDADAVSTPNIGITDNGELKLSGSVGIDGDAVIHTGTNSPAMWDDIINTYHTTLDALIARMDAGSGGGGG